MHEKRSSFVMCLLLAQQCAGVLVVCVFLSQQVARPGVDCCSRCVDGCTGVSDHDFCRLMLCSEECRPCVAPLRRLPGNCSVCRGY